MFLAFCSLVLDLLEIVRQASIEHESLARLCSDQWDDERNVVDRGASMKVEALELCLFEQMRRFESWTELKVNIYNRDEGVS